MKKNYFLVIATILILTIFLTAAFTFNDGNSDTFTLGEDLNIYNDETVDGAVAVLFGDAVVDGTIDGELAVIFGDATINGRVNGNVAAIFGDVIAGENSVIGGSAAAVLGQVKKSPGSVIDGEIASIKGPFRARGINFIPMIGISSLVGLIVFFGLSSLLLVLIPDRIGFMAESASTKIWRRLGIGIAAYILFIPAIIALAITIVGLFVIPFFIAGFFLTVFVGMTSVKLTIGKRITGRLEGNSSQYIYLLVGSVLVFVLPFVPILGWLAYIFASCVGLGIVLDTRLGKPRAKEA